MRRPRLRYRGRVSPAALARRFLASVLIHRSPREMYGRIFVADLLADARSDRRIAVVRSALQLAACRFPRGHSLAQRYLPRILIVSGGGQAFAPTVQACILDTAFVDREDHAAIASLIFHEAAHARIERSGIRYSQARRERIERICVGVQADALSAFGDESAAERARAALLAPWWDDESRLRRRAEQLRAHGMPECVIRWHAIVHNHLFRHRQH